MSTQLANIHDAFFKQVLSDPEAAGTFLREHLPPELASSLATELPEPVPGSFVDEELQQQYADLLFRVRLKKGDNAFAYMLLEHKSSPDPAARLQLLRYVVRILVQWHETNGRRLPLPPVLPLLVHQGPKGWEISCDFMDLFGAIPLELQPYLPSFRHALVDLTRIDDHTLSNLPGLRARLKALKYVRRPDLRERIDVLLAEAPFLQLPDIILILSYIEKARMDLKPDVIQEALHRAVPEWQPEILGCLSGPSFTKGLAEGRAQGHAAGRAEGHRQGEASALLRLLETRFGSLTTAIRERISAADLPTIGTWFERAIKAPDLESVFDSVG
jgi:predicted transposase YdaD